MWDTHSTDVVSVEDENRRHGNPMSKRLTWILASKKKKNDISTNDVESINSENNFSNHSLGHSSLETVKASNRRAIQQSIPSISEEEQKKKSTWKKLKRLVGGTKKPKPMRNDGRSVSDDLGMKRMSSNISCEGDFHRRRVNSVDMPPMPARATFSTIKTPTRSTSGRLQNSYQAGQLLQQTADVSTNAHVVVCDMAKSKLDDAVRGRLDGMDVLYLGPPNRSSLESSSSTNNNATPWEGFPGYSFTGRQTKYTTSDMVTDMLWTSAGRNPPEAVFEGFYRCDRWVVKIEVSRDSVHKKEKSDGEKICPSSPEPPPLQLTDEDSENDEMPAHKLWDSMWGEDNKPPPAPCHMTPADNDLKEDDILELASNLSVPVDVDEDTFIVSSPEHLQAVHEIASVPIQHGKFNDAILVFEKMLKGLEVREDADVNHLKAVALHNIAIILMWQGKFLQALQKFQEAVGIRRGLLPQDNTGLGVSLVREGIACFALGRFDRAAIAFEEALKLSEEGNVVQAKILNNLGVVRYQQGNFKAASKDFRRALEIQHSWLDGQLRRDSIVYDTSVMISNIGRLFIERGDPDLAMSEYEEALMLQTSIFPKDHDVVLASLICLALTKAKAKQLKHAFQIANGVLRSQLTRFRPESVEVIETTGLMAYLQFELEKYNDALKLLTTVQRWQKHHLNPSHHCILKTKKFKEKIEESISTIWI